MAPVSQELNLILIALQILKPQRKRTPEQRAFGAAIGITRKKTKMPSPRHDFE